MSLGLLAKADSDLEKKANEAFKSGKFKEVILLLQPNLTQSSSNTHDLWMLGYAYFQLGSYADAITTFTRLTLLQSNEADAYYYKAKSQSVLAEKYAWNAGKVKEDLMLEAINSYSRAVEIAPLEVQYILSRGLSYLDYGIFKGQKFEETFNKRRAISSLKLAIKDLEEVLNLKPQRHDIQSHIDKAKGYLEDLE